MIFNINQKAEARTLVEAYHYSKRWPSAVQVCATVHDVGGLFGDMGEAVAACCFSIPPTRWTEPVLELSRLVRTHDRIPLTPLISFACKQVKQIGGYDLLVSFADSGQGHHGGIYQAASWTYGGKRSARIDGVVIGGVFVPGRSCNNTWGTRSPEKLTDMLNRNVEPHYDEGKHLYWKHLNRRGTKRAQRLGLCQLPYPKPDGVRLVT